MGVCANCGNENADNKCSRCKVVYYCGRECQKKHWKSGHKHICGREGSTRDSLAVDLKELNKALVSHCLPRMASSGIPAGTIVLDGSANATERNFINMLPRGVRYVLRSGHECPSNSSTTRTNNNDDNCGTVTLVYDTHIEQTLGVIRYDAAQDDDDDDVMSNFWWTDLTSAFVNSRGEPDVMARTDPLLIFWHPKNVKFELRGPRYLGPLPRSVVSPSHADQFCRQLAIEMARPHLANAMMEQQNEPTIEEAIQRASTQTRQFVDAYEHRMQILRTSSDTKSIFPPEVASSDEKRQDAILAKLAAAKGVDVSSVCVRPFVGLFVNNDDGTSCTSCAEWLLMAAFRDLILTRGGCTFCPTRDFVVQAAKTPNVHGCDLELSYSKSYCTHVGKEMQWQIEGMLGMGYHRQSGNKGNAQDETSATDCKVRLVSAHEDWRSEGRCQRNRPVVFLREANPRRDAHDTTERLWLVYALMCGGCASSVEHYIMYRNQK